VDRNVGEATYDVAVEEVVGTKIMYKLISTLQYSAEQENIVEGS